MKRFLVLTVLIAVLVVPSMLFAANKLAMGDAVVTEATVTVPLNVTNLDGLMAMDLPLKFSEGVELKEVNFDDTRVSYFDMKIADIDNDNNTVAIGLITQISAAHRPDLASGTGTVANLVFEVVDSDVTEISVEAVSMAKPDHDLVYIYQEYQDGKVVSQRVDEARFDPVTISLSSGFDVDGLPDDFALSQNYPNPFNPSTIIEFAVPKQSDYSLVIFNVLGQKVSEFSGNVGAGTHQVEWQADSFSSGVYFYKLSAGDFNQTRKMMLLK